MFDKKRGFSPKTIVLLLTIGFLGLFACSMFDRFFLSGDDAKTPLLYQCLLVVFIAIWIFTLMVIIPVQTLYYRRKNRDNSSLQKTTVGDFVGVPFGAYNPDAKLPKWISIPVLGFLWLLVSIFVIFGLLAAIAICAGSSSTG